MMDDGWMDDGSVKLLKTLKCSSCIKELNFKRRCFDVESGVTRARAAFVQMEGETEDGTKLEPACAPQQF